MDFDFDEIEHTLGYQFKERMLLRQAFVRRSYSAENGGENNEILEFVGDEVLGYFVTQTLIYSQGRFSEDREYQCLESEGKLTELRKKLVCKEMLAKRIDILGFAQYLLMGKGDIKNHAEQDPSVKEDLFEAILGAAAYDCLFNERMLRKVIEVMLDPELYLDNGLDANENSVSLLQEWYQKKGYGLPQYSFADLREASSGSDVVCALTLPHLGKSFEKKERSKTLARKAVADAALDYLDDNNLYYDSHDIVPNPSSINAISQLHQLYQHSFISEPQYTDEAIKTSTGIIWHCSLELQSLNRVWKGDYSSKKEAHRDLAYQALLYALKQNLKSGDDSNFMSGIR
jgi:ribonuclease-3